MDKLILELAAKAFGINVLWSEPFERYEIWSTREDGGQEYHGEWSPLDDDGDAFKIQVKLGIDVRIRSGMVECYLSTRHWLNSGDYDLLLASSPIEKNEGLPGTYKSVRYAIALAAAEVGKLLA